jgi:three-Cys-motif partner protein
VAAKSFFEEPLEQSKVKAQIVSGYFDVWSRIILAALKRAGDAQDIAYIDLFAGRGRYKDGTPSTPLLVLKTAVANPEVAAHLHTVFRDQNKEFVASLRKEIANLSGVDNLTNQPNVARGETGEGVVRVLGRMKLMPSLVFLDPCGYKGLSLELVNSVIKDWACECILFFNYNRINAAIDNPAVAEHMDRIFGTSRAEYLRRFLKDKTPRVRENTILRELVSALTEVHGKFVLPFRFRRPTGKRTSHYLVFVTKNFKGYDRMKEVMAHASTTAPQGVSSFEYNPAALLEFQFDKPLDELKERLLIEYAERRIRVGKLYEADSVGTNYLKRNYKQALLELETDDRIEVETHNRGTLADNKLVRFPREQEV